MTCPIKLSRNFNVCVSNLHVQVIPNTIVLISLCLFSPLSGSRPSSGYSPSMDLKEMPTTGPVTVPDASAKGDWASSEEEEEEEEEDYDEEEMEDEEDEDQSDSSLSKCSATPLP